MTREAVALGSPIATIQPRKPMPTRPMVPGIKEARLLSALAPDAARDFRQIQRRVFHAKGETLFVQGGHPRGIFAVSKGAVRLWLSGDGKGVPFQRKVSRGEVLGLSETVSGK